MAIAMKSKRRFISDYGLYSGPENSPIVPENRYFWDVL
jgi:hypothetical protein